MSLHHKEEDRMRLSPSLLCAWGSPILREPLITLMSWVGVSTSMLVASLWRVGYLEEGNVRAPHVRSLMARLRGTRDVVGHTRA